MEPSFHFWQKICPGMSYIVSAMGIRYHENSFGQLEQSVDQEVEQLVKPNAKALRRPRSHRAHKMMYEWWGLCKSFGAYQPRYRMVIYSHIQFTLS